MFRIHVVIFKAHCVATNLLYIVLNNSFLIVVNTSKYLYILNVWFWHIDQKKIYQLEKIQRIISLFRSMKYIKIEVYRHYAFEGKMLCLQVLFSKQYVAIVHEIEQHTRFLDILFEFPRIWNWIWLYKFWIWVQTYVCNLCIFTYSFLWSLNKSSMNNFLLFTLNFFDSEWGVRQSQKMQLSCKSTRQFVLQSEIDTK